jgi:hypothetical protein
MTRKMRRRTGEVRGGVPNLITSFHAGIVH